MLLTLSEPISNGDLIVLEALGMIIFQSYLGILSEFD